MSTRHDTRARILAAARRLLEERGARGTRMADVARAAGVSRQALYLHFGSRAGLLVALADALDRDEGLYDRLASMPEAPDGRTALARSLDVTAWYAPIIHPAAMALYRARDEDDDARAAWDDRMAHRLAELRRICARLDAEGALAPGWTPDEAADALWALGLPPTYDALVEARGWTAEQFRRALFALAGAALAEPLDYASAPSEASASGAPDASAASDAPDCDPSSG